MAVRHLTQRTSCFRHLLAFTRASGLCAARNRENQITLGACGKAKVEPVMRYEAWDAA
jgi:hypothetical protein